MKSPCRGVCSATSLGDPVCRGCGRTFEEVVRWNGLTDDEKAIIIERINRERKDRV